MIEMDHKEHKINIEVMYACTHYHTLHDLLKLHSHSLLLRLFHTVSVLHMVHMVPMAHMVHWFSGH